MPNYYNEGHELKQAYSNLKEFGTKLNCFGQGFVICGSVYQTTSQLRIAEIKKL